LVIVNGEGFENHCLHLCRAKNDLMDKTDATNDPYLAKRQLLEWQIAMGADEAVDNDAADWFARSAVAKADKKEKAEKNSLVSLFVGAVALR